MCRSYQLVETKQHVSKSLKYSSIISVEKKGSYYITYEFEH